MLDIGGDLDHLSEATRKEISLLGYDDVVEDSLYSPSGDHAVVVTDRRLILTDPTGTYVVDFSEVTSVSVNHALMLNTELGTFELPFASEEQERVQQFVRLLQQLIRKNAAQFAD